MLVTLYVSGVLKCRSLEVATSDDEESLGFASIPLRA
jgi:hypothetical protein